MGHGVAGRNERAAGFAAGNTTEQRTAALRAFREETERSVKVTFGEKGYSNYERNHGAYWINSLSPDAANTTKKP